MIISGQAIIAANLVRNVRDIVLQVQPCESSSRCEIYGTFLLRVDICSHFLDFFDASEELAEKTTVITDWDNTQRCAAKDIEIVLDADAFLRPGVYRVEFNEKVVLPLDKVAFLHSRSSLWRSGSYVTSGVIDSDYKGALDALLTVSNPHGVQLRPYARIAQVIVSHMASETTSYQEIYQNSSSLAPPAFAGVDPEGKNRLG